MAICKPPILEGEYMFARHYGQPYQRVEKVDYKNLRYAVNDIDWNKGSLLRPGSKTTWHSMAGAQVLIKKVDGTIEDGEF